MNLPAIVALTFSLLATGAQAVSPDFCNDCTGSYLGACEMLPDSGTTAAATTVAPVAEAPVAAKAHVVAGR